MPTYRRDDRNPADVFKDAVADAEREAKQIAFLVAKYESKASNPDWGHVGSMTHVLEKLREITDFLRGHK